MGRRDPDEIKDRLSELEAISSSTQYVQADLTDIQELNNCFDLILKKSNINGIIHSALVLNDRTIQLMDEKLLKEVLDPKVLGSINLLQIISERNISLDFLLFFSSIQSFIFNPGQANYTASCVFKDAIAHMLNNIYLYNTVTINWGYWGSIGVVANDKYKKRMSALGVGSIEEDEGIEIIEHALSKNLKQVAVIKATPTALMKMGIEAHDALKKHDNNEQVKDIDFNEKVQEYDENDSSVKSNKEAQQLLEDYSRSVAKKINIPNNYLPQYKRLVQAIGNITPPSTEPNKDNIIEKHPWLAKHIELLDHCVQYYTELLAGERDYMQVLFPEGKFDLVEPVYRDNPISDYFNTIVAKTARNYLSAINNKVKTQFNILEIGAGTGSTTNFVVEHLTGIDYQYSFTDISYAFINKARQKFKKYNSLTYQVLNIEETPPKELLNKYDIIIATNVLHATKNIHTTLRHSSSLLKENGIIILNEVTSRQDFATLVFGLTKGWWLYDDNRIPDSPLINKSTWEKLLLTNGFSNLKSHGSEHQAVIVGTAKNQIQNSSEKSISSERKEQVVDEAIINVISDIMQLDVNQINIETEFTDFGIDSLITLELLKPLKKSFGYLPSTIFFEYPTIELLRNHLIKNKVKEIDLLLSIGSDSTKKMEPSVTNNNPNKSNIDDIKELIKSIIAEVMHIDKTDINDQTLFQEYGIDSLITLELLTPLKQEFGYLPSTIFFEYPNISKLSSYLINLKKTDNKSTTNDLEQNQKSQEHRLNTENINDKDIAIIGISGQFPNCNNIDELAERLAKGENCISLIPIERWDNDKFYTSKTSDYQVGKIYTKYGGFINNVSYFDHEFFNITPLDAEIMDPQERLFIQETYKALEDSGYSANSLKGKDIGVFVGVMNGGYGLLGTDSGDGNWADSLYWSIANRTSYLFDWNGPSMAIDTACSSSLTALHQACLAIQNNDASTAIVGGVNLIVHPKQYAKLCRLNMLSSDDKCKSFGSNADGFVDGEGIISIVIKKYKDAIHDNDRIYGVIKGTSVNAGGRSNGYTAPNPNAQANMIKKALSRAGLTPAHIQYIEAHGTGTELGDPVEIRALEKVFNKCTDPINIGSIKSNIGHLESAAGLAGLIKTLLQFKNNKIYPSINSEQINPHLNLDTTPFRVIQKATAIDKDKPYRALISSFGAGGANANVAIECVNNTTIKPINLKEYIIPISAKSLYSLSQYIYELFTWLANNQNIDLYSLAYTLSCTKNHYHYRACIITRDIQHLKQKLVDILFPLKYRKVGSINDRSTVVNLETSDLSLKQIAEQYLSGQEVDWKIIYKTRRIISIPNYSFVKYHHWIDNPKYGLANTDRIFKHHVINNKAIAPACLAISKVLNSKSHGISITNAYWLTPLNNNDYTIQSTATNYKIFGHNEKLHFECDINDDLNISNKFDNFKKADCNYTKMFNHTEIYQFFLSKGYKYGESYKRISWIKLNNEVATSLIHIDRINENISSANILDAGLQSAIIYYNEIINPETAGDMTFLPFRLHKLYCYTSMAPDILYCHSIYNRQLSNNNELSFDFIFTNENNECLLYIEDLRSRDISKIEIKEENSEQHNNVIKIYNFRDNLPKETVI